ncbi:hypothetical protein [Streptomyces antibioticus]|uniref:hypothetical protein n=1 Tax=Streptomyces antibioticus TaxID=1890 RepID=UPI00224E694B|nr:hypothetical protein [Streptomyces antibioticus]MCX4742468.1 hypothetical protein [Streptomyces antibioticus]
MTKKRMRSAVLAISCWALASTAACGTPNAQERKTVQTKTEAGTLPDSGLRAKWPSAGVESGLAAGMRLPLQDYMLSYPDEVTIESAKDKVKTACMARLGFTFTPPAPGTTPSLSYDDMNMERRYGITDAKAAQRYGYQAPVEEPTDDTAAVESAEGRGEEWFDGLDNTCVPEANDRVGILYETDVAGDLAAESLEVTQKDPEVTAAIAKWSACMDKQDHPVDDPLNAQPVPAADGAEGKATVSEIAQANDDVACKQSSSLVTVWQEAEELYQQKQIVGHKSELEAEKARNDEMAAKARAILGEQ